MATPTVTITEASAYGAERVGQYLTAWISADGQGSLWIGLGDTVAASIADAEREAEATGLEREDGDDLVAHLIVKG